MRNGKKDKSALHYSVLLVNEEARIAQSVTRICVRSPKKFTSIPGRDKAFTLSHLQDRLLSQSSLLFSWYRAYFSPVKGSRSVMLVTLT